MAHQRLSMLGTFLKSLEPSLQQRGGRCGQRGQRGSVGQRRSRLEGAPAAGDGADHAQIKRAALNGEGIQYRRLLCGGEGASLLGQPVAQQCLPCHPT
jgi:hypothetical protein